jgi:hypothetical protein
MDRYFRDNPDGTAKAFFEARVHNNVDKGKKCSAESFVKKYGAVFRDCCPAFAKLAKARRTTTNLKAKPSKELIHNPLLTLAQVSENAGSNQSFRSTKTNAARGPSVVSTVESATSTRDSIDYRLDVSRDLPESVGQVTASGTQDSTAIPDSQQSSLGDVDTGRYDDYDDHGQMYTHEEAYDNAQDEGPVSLNIAGNPTDDTVPGPLPANRDKVPGHALGNDTPPAMNEYRRLVSPPSCDIVAC